MDDKKYLKQFSALKQNGLVDPNSRAYLKFASEMDQTFSVDHWNSVCAVTLTLKQADRSEGGKREVLDPIKAERNFKTFTNRLNRAVYGNAVRRHGTKIKVMSSLEKSLDGRLHIHAAIERPPHKSEDEFKAVIERCWSETMWAYVRNSVVFKYVRNSVAAEVDQGWVDYMLKPSQKSGLEAWSDGIDWNSFHNPNC